MVTKVFLSILSVIVIAALIIFGFLFFYFAIPSRKAENSISLPTHVEDSVEAKNASTEQEEEEEADDDIYVADVHQSLTLREGASSSSEEITSLTPMTHLKVVEFVEGTDYALVEVMTGEKEGYQGYVNSEYITRLGEPTIRIGTEE